MTTASTPLSFNFPTIPDEYSPEFVSALLSFLEELGRSAYLRNQHLEVSTGYLIVRSPNGTPWSLEVDDLGVLTPRDVTAEL